MRTRLSEQHPSDGQSGNLMLLKTERLDVSEGEFLRRVAELVDAGKVKPSVIEICG